MEKLSVGSMLVDVEEQLVGSVQADVEQPLPSNSRASGLDKIE